MSRTIKRGSLGLVWLPLLIMVFSTAACTPKRIVQVPSDWHSHTRAQQQDGAPKSVQKPRQQTSPQPASQGPILKRAPAIKEKDLSAAESAESEPPKKPEAEAPPQYLASMHLVDQAKTALGQGKTEAAISMLEQAIQVDVYNGEAFFTLARAWRANGSRQKSLEFARKAEILFQDEPAKLKAVFQFEADIYKDLGDAGKAEQYRQKASAL